MKYIVYICMYTYFGVCKFKHVHIFTYMHMYVRNMYLNACVCCMLSINIMAIFTCMSECYTHAFACVYIHILCIYGYILTYVYIYIELYIHMHVCRSTKVSTCLLSDRNMDWKMESNFSKYMLQSLRIRRQYERFWSHFLWTAGRCSEQN